jgi:hypothetical protein
MAVDTFFSSYDMPARRYYSSGESWATIIAGVGNSADGYFQVYTFAAPTTNTYQYLTRMIVGFNTSSLPDGMTMTSAEFSMVCMSKYDGLAWTPQVALTNGTPGDPPYTQDDYNDRGSTELASRKAYADFSSGTRATWTLNSSGISNINKTGWTHIYVRLGQDVDATPGTWGYTNSYVRFYNTNSAGTLDDPKLTITYTVVIDAVQDGTHIDISW